VTRVLIGVPAYDGRVHASCVESILNCQGVFEAARIETEVVFARDMVVDRARDWLASVAVEREASHLLFVDSDVVFSPEAVEALLAHARLPIVAGVYPRRNCSATDFPVRLDITGPNGDGLIPVLGAPCGFMLIRADVIDAMSRDARRYHAVPRLFEQRWDGDELLSEDFSFCLAAREAGFPIHAVPGLRLGHESTYLNVGTFGR
jgi:hypothetical protein